MLIAFIFFLAFIVVVAFFLVQNANANAVENGKKRAEHIRREDEFAANRLALRDSLFEGWAIAEKAKIDGKMGLVGLRADGSELRLVSCERDGVTIKVLHDEVLPFQKIVGVNFLQEMRSKVITHKETTPVAVGNGKSVGTRALAGALIAGPAGAIVGQASGLSGKSKIEHVETKRSETILVKGHPSLVIDVDDIARPMRCLVFDTEQQTKEWSSRLSTAFNRRKI